MKPTYTAEQLNREVVSRLGVSKIHGVGIIAIQDISAGTSIHTATSDFIITKDELHKLHPEVIKILKDRGCYSTGGGNLYHVEHPNRHQQFEVFINHSNEPNTHRLRTLRDIKAGEELTKSYRDCPIYGIEHMAEQGIEVK